MYNLRYHIASLVAVFLALTVGLVLGTVVVERGVLTKQRTALVSDLTKQYDSLRASNADLRAQVDRSAAFVSQSVPVLTQGVLAGRTVLVITGPAGGETLSDTLDAIRAAGGVPAVATFSKPGLGLDDVAVSERLRAAMGGSTAATDAVRADALGRMAVEWVDSASTRTVTTALMASGALALEGLTPGTVPGGVVLAASFDGKPDPSLVSLAAALEGGNRPVAGVQSTKRTDGVAAAAVQAGLSAVDHIDTPYGALSLVWVLSGRASGWFGTLKGSDGPYPDPLFPKG